MVGVLETIPKGLVLELEDLKSRDYPDYSIIKISQKTESWRFGGDLVSLKIE